MWLYFLQGFTLGIAYVAPIGMQNLFVINSAISKTRLQAYQTALVIIFFDVTLALACFWGIGTMMEKFQLLKMVVLFAGSLAVIWIGVQLIRSKSDGTGSTPVQESLLKLVTTACVVTWFNPQALIDGSLLLGAFKASLPSQASSLFIIGVCLASFSWFIALSTLVSTLKHSFTAKIINRINLVCGLIIVFYGLKLGWHFIQMLL